MDVAQGKPPSHGPSSSLPTNLRADYQALLLSTYQSLTPYLAPVLGLALKVQEAATTTLVPLVDPLVARAQAFADEQPAAVTAVVMLVVLVVSLRVLSFARRVIMWGVGLVVRVVFWGALGLVAWVVWERGLGRTVAEVAEWGRGVGEVWLREYRRWDGLGNQGTEYTYGGYGGGGRNNARTGWR